MVLFVTRFSFSGAKLFVCPHFSHCWKPLLFRAEIGLIVFKFLRLWKWFFSIDNKIYSNIDSYSNVGAIGFAKPFPTDVYLFKEQ